MNGERQLQGNTLSLCIRHVRRAAGEPVGHKRAHVDIVTVVVLSVLRAVGGIGSTCPLGIVACSFERARHPAGRASASDVSHASTEADCVGCHHTFMTAEIGELHAVEFAVSFVEFERAEINPRAAAHLLIHAEHSLLPFVAHHIFCVGDAVAQCLIAHVDSIASFFRKTWRVGDETGLLPFACGLCHTRRSCLEGVLSIVVYSVVEGESGLRRVDPVVFHSLLDVVVRSGFVVVDNQFVSLPVAFARSEDDGTRILEHRDEIRYDDGLCKKVFRRAEEERSLPLPKPFLLVEVAAVAGPDAEVAVVKSVGNLVGA